MCLWMHDDLILLLCKNAVVPWHNTGLYDNGIYHSRLVAVFLCMLFRRGVLYLETDNNVVL